MKKILISPPFSLYIPNTPISTSIRGTFTIRPRLPIYPQVFKTCRPVKGGWVNSMGFRNRGIESELDKLRKDNEKTEDKYIWSIGVTESEKEWTNLFYFLSLRGLTNINLELNLGCKNVNKIGIFNETLKAYVRTFNKIIIKLPCDYEEARGIIDVAYSCGVRSFHCSNTLKTPKGSESSKRIQLVSIPTCNYINYKYPDCIIIGGGGIYSAEDVNRYRDSGATHFSLATVLLKPWKLFGIIREVYNER